MFDISHTNKNILCCIIYSVLVVLLQIALHTLYMHFISNINNYYPIITLISHDKIFLELILLENLNIYIYNLKISLHYKKLNLLSWRLHTLKIIALIK